MQKTSVLMIISLPEPENANTFIVSTEINRKKLKARNIILDEFKKLYPIFKSPEDRSEEEKKEKIAKLVIGFNFGDPDLINVELRKEKKDSGIINMLNDEEKIEEILITALQPFILKDETTIHIIKGPDYDFLHGFKIKKKEVEKSETMV